MYLDKTDAKALNTATIDELMNHVKKLTQSGVVPASQLSQLHPNKQGVVEFYADVSKLTEVDFKPGDGSHLFMKFYALQC